MKRLIFFLLVTTISLSAFSVNPVTVIYPNGGENLTIGCPYAIQWVTANTTGPVKIELYKNNAFCLTICSQVPAGMTTYTWIPPISLVPASTYKVKITSLTSASGFDFSDGNFLISQGTIIVVSPNGGETWQKGSTHQILWSDNICDNVRIELWKSGVFNSVIAPSVPSNGIFSWAIPATNTLIPGSDYKIKIISIIANSATVSQVYDFSDNNFSISQGNFILVTSPNGGEFWVKGTTRIIQWQDNITWNVRIELWKGGAYCALINASAPSNGSCYWAIPYTLSSGNDYKVRISALNTAGSPLFDFSDNNFSITGTTPTPAITPFDVVNIYPNPGNNLLHVKFQGEADFPLMIDILNFDGDLMLHQLIDAVTANETIELNVSGLPGGNYLVVVRKDNTILSRSNVMLRH